MSDDVEDIDTDREPKEKKKRGRPKNENYLPWEEARTLMRDEMIPSRGKFFEWWDVNKPKAIPRFPYRVYKDEWTSWNDFLGTNNKFNEKVGTKWRPFLEATAWALTLGLQGQQDWMDYSRQEGNLPADIPARPDLVYDGWRSWGHWLGHKTAQKIEAKQEVAKKIQVYYIINYPDVPQNVLTFGIEPMGLSAMKARWQEEGFTIVKMFWYDPVKVGVVKQILDAFSRPYMGQERQRIVPNVWEIVYHMQMHMEQITSKDV